MYTPTLKSELLSSARFKSFLWRGGAILAITGLNYVSTNLGIFNLSPQAVIIVGLVIGEITKAINNVVQFNK